MFGYVVSLFFDLVKYLVEVVVVDLVEVLNLVELLFVE